MVGVTTTDVATRSGSARVTLRLPEGPVRGTVVLTHGAGGANGTADLRALGAAAVGLGLAAVAVLQPYRVAGRRTPPAPEAQDADWLEVVAALEPVRPLVLAGRSNGARVACRAAAACGAAGVVALAFPVHPPGRPDRDRSGELAAPPCPVLVVQGERDTFGVPARARGRRLVVVPGTGHDLRGAAPVVEREARAFLRRVLREGDAAGQAGTGTSAGGREPSA